VIVGGATSTMSRPYDVDAREDPPGCQGALDSRTPGFGVPVAGA